MTLDELKIQVAMDLKVNDERLDTESLKNQELYAKYLEVKSNFELLMYKAKGDYKRLYREKWEYYGGKADPEVYKEKPLDLKILKQDVPIYLEGDKELIESQHTVEYHKAMVDHAEKMCKMLNNRGFQIKNAIDWKRFMEGSI